MDNGDSTYWDGTATEASTDESGNAIEAKTAEQDAQEKINKLKETTEAPPSNQRGWGAEEAKEGGSKAEYKGSKMPRDSQSGGSKSSRDLEKIKVVESQLRALQE